MSHKALSLELQSQAQQVLQSCPLVPVITITAPKQAVPLAKALVAGGIRILEVTLRTEYGLDAIRQMRDALPDVWVGAGTVLTPKQFEQAEEAGAQFVITPGLTRKLLKHGLSAKVPLIPGVATLSEVMEGYTLGYRTFKLFPAEVAGGVNALKAFSGPLPDASFCPTGGIRKETAKPFLDLPNVVAVGGTWLTPADLVEQGDWEQISRIAEESLALLR